MSPRFSIRLLAAQSDQRLVALAREGQERAFEALVHRYRRPLLRYCRRMRLSDARAEDVLQQALLQAWLALQRGVEVREARGWLYRIVHNAAVNAMRGAGEAHGELTQAVQDRAALGNVSNLERRIALREALSEVAALPRLQRQAIFLTAVDGQSHDEVASTLGISQGALRGLLYRARTTLRGAAAAITPQPLLEWAMRGGGTVGATAERFASASASASAGAGVGGGGTAGVVGLLLKGGVAAVMAGALASGASVLATHEQHARHAHRGSLRRTAETIGSQASGAALLAEAQPSRLTTTIGARSDASLTAGQRGGRGGRGDGREGRGAGDRDDGTRGELLEQRQQGRQEAGGSTFADDGRQSAVTDADRGGTAGEQRARHGSGSADRRNDGFVADDGRAERDHLRQEGAPTESSGAGGPGSGSDSGSGSGGGDGRATDEQQADSPAQQAEQGQQAQQGRRDGS